MRSLLKFALVATVALSPVYASGAESFKLRYVQTVAADANEAVLKSPEGIACTNKSSFIVADTGNGRLLRYTFQDRKLTGGTEIKAAEIPKPVLLQLNSKEEIYVLDGGKRRIARLNADGTFSGYFEPQGVTEPATVVVKSFKIDSSDHIFLLDIYGARVIVADQAGKVLRQVKFPEGAGFISDLAVTQGGDILLVDSIKPAVYVAQKDAAQFQPLVKDLKDYVKFATYITTDSRGTVYVVDQNGGSILAMGLDGTVVGRQLELGWKNSLVYYPSQTCVNNAGEVFVADRGNSRVQIFERLK